MICLLSIVDIALQTINDHVSTSSLFKTISLNFRGLRFLKVMRVANLWPPFASMVVKKSKTRRVISSFFVLILLFVAMYGMIGFEYFQDKIKMDTHGHIIKITELEDHNDHESLKLKSPRLNFDTFWDSVLSVFVCLLGDEWNVIMVDTMRAYESHITFIYFVPLIIIGQFFLMNIFLAIHIKCFEEYEKA